MAASDIPTTDKSKIAYQETPPSVEGYLFQPREDITAFELASVLQAVLSAQQTLFLKPLYDEMPEAVKKHFVKKEAATASWLNVFTSPKAPT